MAPIDKTRYHLTRRCEVVMVLGLKSKDPRGDQDEDMDVHSDTTL